MALWGWPQYGLGTKKGVFGTHQGVWRVVAIEGLWHWSCVIWFGLKKRCFGHTQRCLKIGFYIMILQLAFRLLCEV